MCAVALCRESAQDFYSPVGRSNSKYYETRFVEEQHRFCILEALKEDPQLPFDEDRLRRLMHPEADLFYKLRDRLHKILGRNSEVTR